MSCFEEHEIIQTGIKHGTVAIILDSKAYEVTTFRSDGLYSDNRHPSSVSYVTDLHDDLSRRDFTINAMAYNNDEGIIDIFGGIYDLENNIIRCVGNADNRFKEDALRIMRAIRFAATLGNQENIFSISNETSKALFCNAHLLLKISKERIQDELNKTLLGYNGISMLRVYKDIFAVIIPELKLTFPMGQNHPAHTETVYDHMITATSLCENKNDLICLLTLFIHDIGKPYTYTIGTDGYAHFPNHWEIGKEIAYQILTRLKYSNKIRDAVCELIYWHDFKVEDSKTIKYLLNKIGKKQFERLLIIKEADGKAHTTWNDKKITLIKVKDIYKEIIDNNECYSLNQLAVNGNDMISLGYAGVDIGKKLLCILDDMVNGNIKNEYDEIMRKMNNANYSKS